MAENTRIHILVVDDDRGILELVRRSLEHEGYQVDTIENSKAVLEQNLEWYQMIILDVMMPGWMVFHFAENFGTEWIVRFYF